MKKIILSISFVLLYTSASFAQSLSSVKLLCDSCERHISFRFESTSFLKNNEYFDNFSKGQTGIGFFLKPAFEYYFTQNTKATAGVFLLKYSGSDNFSQVIPIFSIQQKLTKNLELILGSIYGTLNHQLEEPLFKFDRYYENNVEYGLQILYNSSLIESDIWLNWEKYIFINSPFQEELTFGNTTKVTTYQSDNLSVCLPLQLLITHKGGQIDSSPNPVASVANAMTGLNINYKIDAENSIGFEPQIFFYQGLGLPETGINSQPYQNGKALYFKINYTNKFISSTFGYWVAKKFIAPRGEYLFQSVSDWKENFSQEDRKLITIKTEMQHKLSESVKMVLRSDGYYDVTSKKFSYAGAVYFVINESFFISKIKNNK